MIATNELSARDMFPAPRLQDGTLDSSFEPAFLAVVATNEDSIWNFGYDAKFHIAVRGSDTFPRPFRTGDLTKTRTPAASTRTDIGDRPDDRPSIVIPSGVGTRSQRS